MVLWTLKGGRVDGHFTEQGKGQKSVQKRGVD